ncbi:hypothetical protein PIB30_086711 [Stylosanthes scabra]|uniref:Uncharacterized protein n=1 Tax=Stylosanthes scabra TaxID=79078 RepID=A0ABU6TSR3_9FABA|nr:hypothetical protein [Stylosanthes scabra]
MSVGWSGFVGSVGRVSSDATPSEHAVPHSSSVPASTALPLVPALHYSPPRNSSITLPRPRCLTIPRYNSTSFRMLLSHSHLHSPSLLPNLSVQIVHIDRSDPRLLVRANTYSSSVGVDDFVF